MAIAISCATILSAIMMTGTVVIAAPGTWETGYVTPIAISKAATMIMTTVHAPVPNLSLVMENVTISAIYLIAITITLIVPATVQR